MTGQEIANSIPRDLMPFAEAIALAVKLTREECKREEQAAPRELTPWELYEQSKRKDQQ